MNPLVSCIMPTRGRSAMAALAIRSYEAQAYTPRELIVIDDADMPSFPGGCPQASHYERLPTKLTVGAKRNIAVNRASGVIICHFDSDDWSAPLRIADQVQRLQETGKDVTGYRTIIFLGEDGQCWNYEGGHNHVLGTSLCYTKRWWETHPFRDVDVTEDESFSAQAWGAHNLAVVDGSLMIVARIHAENVSPKTPAKYKVYRPLGSAVEILERMNA